MQLFEIGTRFSAGGRDAAASRSPGPAPAAGEHWSGGAREVDFFDVKGVVEHLCDALGVAVRVRAGRASRSSSPGSAAAIVIAGGADDGARLGVVGQLAPALADARGLPRQDARLRRRDRSRSRCSARAARSSDATRPLPRYPFVVRDLSIVVADTLPAEIIRGTILSAGRDLPAPLVAMSFFDRYQGKGVPDGAVSLSVRLTFQAADRTLTDAEVQHERRHAFSRRSCREHGAVQR